MILKNPMPNPSSPREDVAAIQEMLVRLGYRVHKGPIAAPEIVTLKVDGLFGGNTEDAVMAFQEDEGLMADGIVGANTLDALEAALARREIELTSPGSGIFQCGEEETPGQEEKLSLTRVQADAYNEGYTRFSLRSDAAEAYNQVRATVNSYGGIITSSGGIRSLSANVSASRSATSMHYVGRAFDLFIYSGMVDARKDPFVVVKTDEPRKYRVYARCKKAGSLAQKMTLQNVVTYKKRDGTAQATGIFLDLTALFAEHGFRPIRARKSFERGGTILGAEWWHFQNQKGLIPGATTFGAELLKLYSLNTLEGTPPWKSKDRVFGINWH